QEIGPIGETADREADAGESSHREQECGVQAVARAPLAAALLTQDGPDRGPGARSVARQVSTPSRRWWRSPPDWWGVPGRPAAPPWRGPRRRDGCPARRAAAPGA